MMNKHTSFLFLSMLLLQSCIREIPQLKSIEIEPAQVIISVSESYQLTALHSPGKMASPPYTWRSEDSQIVQVNSNGTITGKSAGTTWVHVYAVSQTLHASCEIIVNAVEATSIKLNKSELFMDVNEQETLSYTFEPTYATDPAVTWSSDNIRIAKVDNSGKVTAVGPGETYIRARSGLYAMDICKVTVAPIRVTGIELLPSFLSIEREESETIIAVITPADATNKNLIWWSKESNIAQVDLTGTVQGVTVGTTTVYARTEDRDFIAQCEVEVRPVSVKGIELDKEILEVIPGIQYTLNATVWPQNADNQAVRWESLNPDVATVQEGVVYTHQPGEAIIQAITEDNGHSARCRVLVKDISEFVYATANPTLLSWNSNNIVNCQLTGKLTNPTPYPVRIVSVFLYNQIGAQIQYHYSQNMEIAEQRYSVRFNPLQLFGDYMTIVNQLAKYKVVFHYEYGGRNYQVAQWVDPYTITD